MPWQNHLQLESVCIDYPGWCLQGLHLQVWESQEVFVFSYHQYLKLFSAERLRELLN
jgi:hypothetical protein